MNALINVGFFLVNIFFALCFFVLWLRFFLRAYRVSTLHPVHKLINQLCSPLLSPVEHIFYRKNTKPPHYDFICLTFIILLELFKFILIGLMAFSTWLPLHDIMSLTIGDLLIQPLNLFFYMILIQVIMSWVNPHWHHPAAEIIEILTKPLFHLGRHIVPNVSGFDFAPFIILILIKVLTLFISGLMPLHLLAWL